MFVAHPPAPSPRLVLAGLLVTIALIRGSTAQGPTLVHKWLGNSNHDHFGQSVASIGDTNGDGVPDLLVGAWHDDPAGRTDAGAATLFSGANGSEIRRHDGGAAFDLFGFALAGAGDVDGDGRADYVIGAYLADAGANATGRVTMYSGASGAALWSRSGAVDDLLGYAVAGIGDVNGDGVPDVAAVAREVANSGSERGYVLLLAGNTGAVVRTIVSPGPFDFAVAVAGAGDTDGDNVPDVVVGSPVVNSNRGGAWLFSGASGALRLTLAGSAVAGAQFGTAVAGIGDVDGDGRLDVAVGAPQDRDAGAVQTGSVRCYSGSTGALLWLRFGQASTDRFGAALCSAGDLDGDNVPDVAVGAPNQDDGAEDAGVVWTFTGSTGAQIERVRAADGIVEGGRLFGSSLGGGHDIDRDGNDDLIVGAPLEGFGATPDFGSAMVIAVVRVVDTDVPAVTITAPRDGEVFASATVLVSAAITDASSSTVSSNPAGVSGTLPAGGGMVSGMLALDLEGANTLTVTATDQYQNTGGASITVVRDTIAPAVRILAPAAGAVLGMGPALVSAEIVDATATVVTLGGSSLPLPAGGGTVSVNVALTEGNNVIAVSVVDAAGNRRTEEVTVVLDLNAPVVSIAEPADGASFGPGQASVPVVARVDDLTATVVASSPLGVNGTTPAGGGLVAGAVELREGSNQITITATDASERAGSATITVTLDTTPPAVAVVAPLEGSRVRSFIDFHATAADPAPGTGIARVDFFADATLVASLTAPPFECNLPTTTLADGSHVLRALAVDAKGNEREASVTVLVDNTPPAVAFTTPADHALVGGTVPFALSVSDATSGVTSVAVDAGGLAPTVDPSLTYSPPVASASLVGQEDTTRRADGDLVLHARAHDDAGNEATASLHLRVQNAAPPTCTLTPADLSVVRGTVDLVATATGAIAQIELKLDGVTLATASTSPLQVPLATAAVLDGVVRAEAVVTDSLGRRVTCTSNLLVDNLDIVKFNPRHIDIRPRPTRRRDEVIVRVEGVNVALLMPVEAHQIELRVPGASPVPLAPGWSGDDHTVDRDGDGVPELRLMFERELLEAALRAGVAAGAISRECRNTPVEVKLAVDGREIDTTQIRATHVR